GVVVAVGVEPEPWHPASLCDRGRRIPSSGLEATQVGPGQHVAEGAVSKVRTEAAPAATEPGPGGNTTGAQQEHDAEGGPLVVDSGLLEARNASAGEAVVPGWSLPADLQTVVDAWPRVPEGLQAAILT